jgi:hypothetical protein
MWCCTIVWHDATTVGNYVKDTWGFFALFPTTVYESTIFSKLKGPRHMLWMLNKNIFPGKTWPLFYDIL